MLELLLAHQQMYLASHWGLYSWFTQILSTGILVSFYKQEVDNASEHIFDCVAFNLYMINTASSWMWSSKRSKHIQMVSGLYKGTSGSLSNTLVTLQHIRKSPGLGWACFLWQLTCLHAFGGLARALKTCNQNNWMFGCSCSAVTRWYLCLGVPQAEDYCKGRPDTLVKTGCYAHSWHTLFAHKKSHRALHQSNQSALTITLDLPVICWAENDCLQHWRQRWRKHR